jgi:hypothetical protein
MNPPPVRRQLLTAFYTRAMLAVKSFFQKKNGAARPGSPTLPAGTLNATAAFFESHLKCVWQMTCDAAMETRGNPFQFLRTGNTEDIATSVKT